MPTAPVLPPGFEIAAVDPNDDEVMAQAHRLFHDTSSEHHGHEDTEVSLADYAEQWRTTESYDPSAWWFAYEGATPIGLLLGDDRRASQGQGYVQWVGVVRGQRGHGVARALLLTAFNDYQQRGRAGVQLGVDTANTTGATRLYESVGMHVIESAIALGRTVTI